MPQASTAKRQKSGTPKARQADAFRLRRGKEAAGETQSDIHVLGPGIVCDTEARGHATPHGQSPLEIVVDATAGFIPLWAPNTILRWRFRERSMSAFANPAAARREIRSLFAEALVAWDTAAPVRFTEDKDLWDFEIVMRPAANCSPSGCVLASSFFPDAGRHQFYLYPTMFTQDREEQVETFIHEIGHIFGLRHFFAKLSEGKWPSEIFGEHSQFSIMNYGSMSKLTDADRNDLAALYHSAWNGELKEINGTPIQLVKPFSALASIAHGIDIGGGLRAAAHPRRAVACVGDL